MKKNDSLEGLRAIVCIGIVLSQFLKAFLPQYDSWVLESSFKILLTSDTLIRILFVLSGFAISYKFFEGTSKEKIPQDIVNCWFKLAPTIIVANLIVYIMMKLKMLYNVEAGNLSGSTEFISRFNNFEPNLARCIKEAFLTCYTQGANEYISPLWIIRYEFWGCILILVAMYLCQSNGVLKWIFYAISLFGFSNYYNNFVLGMLACDLLFNSSIVNSIKERQVLNNLLFLISCYVVCMTNIIDIIKSTRVMWGIAVVIMLITLVNGHWSQRILGNKFCTGLGKISYSMYVVYWPIMESFSSKLYLWFSENTYFSQIVMFRMNLVLTLGVIVGVSIFLNKYVESIGDEVVLKIESLENKIDRM